MFRLIMGFPQANRRETIVGKFSNRLSKIATRIHACAHLREFEFHMEVFNLSG